MDDKNLNPNLFDISHVNEYLIKIIEKPVSIQLVQSKVSYYLGFVKLPLVE